MKYSYAYKTSDGARHENVIVASTREEVFTTLRQRGIKAIKVVALDGSKANGELRGIRKRVVVALVVVSILASLTAYIGGIKSVAVATVIPNDIYRVSLQPATPLSRQMIVGDRQRLEQAIAALSNGADRCLAAFAEPGRILRYPLEDRPSDSDFSAALTSPILIASDELTESIDLKRILTGIKREMRDYILGGGSVSDYLSECVNRQRQEVDIRNRAEERLGKLIGKSDKEAYDFLLKANAQLQSMGIYPIPIPDKLREYQFSLNFNE